ncbi:hypothetical protein ABZS66_57870 [Dactylosporangium sp. NPDC005572]|uniref:hypothetical protein n=1 Tax=Dactylosporangium sp. NPDC005572 TaxID=3156889 RepID=UPI0033AC2DDF
MAHANTGAVDRAIQLLEMAAIHCTATHCEHDPDTVRIRADPERLRHRRPRGAPRTQFRLCRETQRALTELGRAVATSAGQTGTSIQEIAGTVADAARIGGRIIALTQAALDLISPPR